MCRRRKRERKEGWGGGKRCCVLFGRAKKTEEEGGREKSDNPSPHATFAKVLSPPAPSGQGEEKTKKNLSIWEIHPIFPSARYRHLLAEAGAGGWVHHPLRSNSPSVCNETEKSHQSSSSRRSEAEASASLSAWGGTERTGIRQSAVKRNLGPLWQVLIWINWGWNSQDSSFLGTRRKLFLVSSEGLLLSLSMGRKTGGGGGGGGRTKQEDGGSKKEEEEKRSH